MGQKTQDNRLADEEFKKVFSYIGNRLYRLPQASADELVKEIEKELSREACSFILSAIYSIYTDPALTTAYKQYLKSMLDDESLENALLRQKLRAFILYDILLRPSQPSADELLAAIEEEIGLKARWHLAETINEICRGTSLTNAHKNYLRYMLEDGSLAIALAGQQVTTQQVDTGISHLLSQSNKYKKSSEFQEMIEFMGQFRDYAPYNNMLVRIQNPSCRFYATAGDWERRFERNLKEDATPMLILAPMHPVMLVYDVDQTDGKSLPEELNQFSTFEGEWESKWLENIIENAFRHRIRIDFKKLGTANSGFATFSRQKDNMKRRIAVHDELDEPSRFGVICHELAHIFLGHLGSDKDLWWPCRTNLSHRSVEIEAEAVAFIVTHHLGLKGSSASYVSRYLGDNDQWPESVSIDHIAKVAGKLKQMASGLLPESKKKPIKKGLKKAP